MGVVWWTQLAKRSNLCFSIRMRTVTARRYIVEQAFACETVVRADSDISACALALAPLNLLLAIGCRA